MTQKNSSGYQPQEEVDVLSFFQALGKFFSSIGTAIKSLFKLLFHVLIFLPYVYLKRFGKIVIPLLILAIIAGFYLDSGEKAVSYKAEILVSPNYDSGKELYTTIDYLNSLVEAGEYAQLGNVLGLDSARASAYLNFSIEPNVNERITVRDYQQYISYMDSSVVEIMKYDKYGQSFSKQPFDYPQQKITVIASEPDVFEPLNNFFGTFLDQKKLFDQRRGVRLAMIKENIGTVQKTLAQTDSLRKAIDIAIKNLGKSSSSQGQNIIVGTSHITFPETQYDLFTKKQELMNQLNKLKRDLVESEHVLILNSLFPKQGHYYSPISHQYKFLLPLLVVLLFLIVVYFFEMIRFLELKYRKEYQSQNGK